MSSGYNTIKLKRTTTTGMAPSTSIMSTGEPAVNLTDKRLWILDQNGNLIDIAGASYALKADAFVVTGDVSGTGTVQGGVALTLASVNANAGTTSGITTNDKGLVTAMTALVPSDIPTLTASKISDFDAQVRTSTLNQMAAPTTSLDMNSQRIVNVANAITPSGVTTLTQVQSLISAAVAGGVNYRGTVDATAATTVLAGVIGTPVNGDMYKVTAAPTPPTLSPAFSLALDPGDFVVFNGTTWDRIADTNPTVTNVADRTTVTATGDSSYQVDIASTYAGQTSITTLGTIATGVWQGTIVGAAYGGSGRNYTLDADGSIYKFDATAGNLVIATVGVDYLSNSSIIDGGTF